MKLRMKMLFSLAFAMVFIASAVGFSVFAGGPYTEETLPGFQEVTNEVSFNDTTYSVTRKKVVFEYHVFSYLGFCSNESEEIWTQDVEDDGVPSDILNNGYSFYFMKEMFITPDYYLEGSQSGDVTYKIFRGWAFCDENRNLISEPSEEIRFTEEDFGCYITPVYTKATSQERQTINEEKEHSLVGYADTWYDETSGTNNSIIHYLGEGDFRIEKRELTGDELSSALSRAGVDEKNKVAWEIEIYPLSGTATDNPCFIVDGKSIPVALPKPDVEGADSFSIVHLLDDGTKEEIPASIDGDQLQFLITSCSPFVPFGKSSGTTEEDPSSTTTTTTAATTDEVTTTTTDTNAPTDSADTTMDNTNDKSNSPDTGEGSLAPVLVIFILSIVFAAGAVGFGLLRKGVRADSLEKE